MKRLVEYIINEGQININIADLKKRAKKINNIKGESEKDFETLNSIAMDLLDAAWHNSSIETKEWKQFYNMYHVAVDTWSNNNHKASIKHFKEMINSIVDEV